MRVLVVGDSHVGAFLKQFKEQFADPTTEVAFLSRPKRVINLLSFSEHGVQLAPKLDEWGTDAEKYTREIEWHDSLSKRIKQHSGSNGRLEISQFDKVILIGSDALPLDQECFRWWEVVTSPPRYSRALQRNWLEDRLLDLQSQAYKWALQLNKLSHSADVYLVLNPYFNELSGVTVPGNSNLSLLNSVYSSLFKKLNVSFIDYPEALYSDDHKTIARRFKKTSNPTDFFHLNDEGGAILYKRIAEAVF